jgi:S1-C subfamily serine protease
MPNQPSRREALAAALGGAGYLAFQPVAHADVPAQVKTAEAERIAVIAKVRPATAAVCFFGGKVCGSGVVISEDGYCLTNFHVVQPTGPIMQCGLDNGQLYDSVIVGMDKVGDVALVKLLPKKPGDKFPFAPLGDSDKVEAGEWSLAMGNPFGLALDFTPTVTYGLVSGVNRYQPPEGKGTLEYTDCIQIDTSINPGNSGGPLFNMKGELIGINGRGSFEKRGRVNSGVGYAISINQIKNFLGQLMAGIDTDHATLGALVTTESEEGDLSRMFVDQVLDESDAARRGLKPKDQLLAFAGRRITSTNQYKNVLGIYPKDWKLPLVYRRGTTTKEMLVRLMGNMEKLKDEGEGEKPKPGPGGPRPGAGGPPPNPGIAKSPAKPMYKEKKGFANFHFNNLAVTKLMEAFTKATGDFKDLGGPWGLEGTIVLAERNGNLKLQWAEDTDGFTEVKLVRDTVEDKLKLSAEPNSAAELATPQGSGGLLAALYQYRNFLVQRAAGFSPNENAQPGFIHGGAEPFYPPAVDGKMPAELASARIDCEVIRTRKGGMEAKWYFNPKDATLLGFESWFNKGEDPCEVFFYDYKDAAGVKLPHRMVVRYADKTFATVAIRTYTLAKK